MRSGRPALCLTTREFSWEVDEFPGRGEHRVAWGLGLGIERCVSVALKALAADVALVVSEQCFEPRLEDVGFDREIEALPLPQGGEAV